MVIDRHYGKGQNRDLSLHGYIVSDLRGKKTIIVIFCNMKRVWIVVMLPNDRKVLNTINCPLTMIR